MACIPYFSRTGCGDNHTRAAKRPTATLLVAGMALALALGALSWRSPAAQASPIVRTPLQPYGLIAMEQYPGCDFTKTPPSCPAVPSLSNAASNPAIAGLMIRVPWKDMQPTSGADSTTNWSITDAAFTAAEQSTSISQPRGGSGPSTHKFVVLGFVPGFDTPAWALTDPAGKLPPVQTASFCIPYGIGAGTVASLPLPWDKTYLNNWSNFLQQVAAHYAGKTDLLMVAAAGPTSVSDEMSLPGGASSSSKCNSTADTEADDLATWEKLGYTPSQGVSAWNTAFQDMQTSFPGRYASLSLYPGLPIGSMGMHDSTQRTATPQSVISAEQPKLGTTFAVQQNGLTYSSGGPDDSMYRLVTENNGKAVTGFQLDTSATKDLTAIQHEGGPSLGAGDGATALNNALQAGITSPSGVGTGVDFLQVYEDDVDAASTNAAIQSVLQGVAAQLPLPQYSPAYTPPPPPRPTCHGFTPSSPATCT